MNPAECLTALTSEIKKHKVVVYDLESKDGASQCPGFTRVFLGGVFDGRRYRAFRNTPRAHEEPWEVAAIAEGGCIDQLMRYLLSHAYRGRFIYAHNGGSFDHLHILPWLTQHIDEFSYKVIPVQSSIQILRVTSRKGGHVWTFLDSLRILPMGLDAAAKTFGYQGKLEHSLALDEEDPSWERYLRRDCEALYETVTQFQHLVTRRLGGEMGVTAPSTAMKLYRRKFMGHGKAPAMIPHHRHFPECEGQHATRESQTDVRCRSGGGGRERRLSSLRVGDSQVSDRDRGRTQKSVLGGSLRVSPLRASDLQGYEGCTGCLHEWIRLGYYGGRVERFRPSGKGLSYYDINSSYPRAMLEPMPGGDLTVLGDCSVEALRSMARDHIGFVQCEVEIPESCYLPPLPHRDAKSGKLIFPVGNLEGVWSWSELTLLDHPLVRGRIRKVIRSAWYGTEVLFFDFVKELYAFRDKSAATYEEGLALVSKLMMNSLYGKFGMNEDRREICVLAPGEAPPEGATFPTFEDGDPDLMSRVCYVEKRVSPPYVMPQISAHITALARVRLWNFMAQVLDRGGKLYYCDTDSLITDIPDLPCSADLGELKNEYPGEVLDVEIAGPKMYLLRKSKPFEKEHRKDCPGQGCKGCRRTKLAMKGLPKDKRTARTLRNLQAGKKVHYQRLEKLGGMVQEGLARPPRMLKVHKSMKGGNEKRVMLESGDSKPIVLGKGRLIW